MKTWQHIYVVLEHALAYCLHTIWAPWIISNKPQKICALILPSAKLNKFGFYRNTMKAL